jgi:hypothetical protein
MGKNIREVHRRMKGRVEKFATKLLHPECLKNQLNIHFICDQVIKRALVPGVYKSHPKFC